MKKEIDYKKQGKQNLDKGRRFELVVRKDLEGKDWIISKWQNNVEFNYEIQPEDPHIQLKIGRCVSAKQGIYRKTSTGFPDFIAFRPRSSVIQEMLGKNTKVFGSDVIMFIECKTNGYLSKEEKAKAKWYLENNYCSKFLIASKGKKRGEIKYVEFSP